MGETGETFLPLGRPPVKHHHKPLQEAEAKAIGSEVDGAEKQLHQVKEELLMLNVEISCKHLSPIANMYRFMVAYCSLLFTSSDVKSRGK